MVSAPLIPVFLARAREIHRRHAPRSGDLDKDNPFILMRSVFNWTLKLFHRKVSMAIAGSDYAKKTS